MNITAQQIYDECGESAALILIDGEKAAKITGIAPFQASKKGDLVFVPDMKALEQVLEQGVSTIVISKKILEKASELASDVGILVSANLGYSHAKIKQKYGDHDDARTGWPPVHPSAIVHERVDLPKDVVLGPNVVIEQGVLLGEGCQIMANVVIQHDAVIGKGVTIHPGTIIGWECKIGDQCLILSNTVIGGEGFGYAQDQYFNHHRIPQTGNVEIGDKVTIGANCTIDRATYGSTMIGDGCIFDNICHVAHNVTMGKNCIIISGFLCGGSCTIGDRVVASGNTMIKDHVNICNDVYLMHRAGVVKDITEPGMYAGGPVLPMKEYTKNRAIYNRLGELRQQVMRLERAFK